MLQGGCRSGESGNCVSQWSDRVLRRGAGLKLTDVEDVVQPAAAAGSHGLGISEAVRLARVLDRLPVRLISYAVEVADTGFGTGLSAEVADAVPSVAACVRRDVSDAASAEPLARRAPPGGRAHTCTTAGREGGRVSPGSRRGAVWPPGPSGR